MKSIDMTYAELTTWLESNLGQSLRVIEGYIMGSTLTDFERASDVDLLLLLANRDNEECKVAARFIQGLCKQFCATFDTRLHVTAFSLMEEKEYEMFKEQAKQLTKLSAFTSP